MKHRFVSKKYWKDMSTEMGQSDEKAKLYPDVINLSLGDPDMITAEEIIEAAFEDARRGHTKYTEFRGDPELRQEIVKYYEEEFGIKVADDEIFVTASGCLAMYLALAAILDEGDEVILQAPYFTPYPQQVQLAGGIPVELETYEEEDFQINFKRLEEKITARTKAIVINSPSNPTGNCLNEDSLRQLAKIAEEKDLIVISDEIYTAYSFQEKFVPFVKMDGMKERTITINSFSKNFIMTGWRVGNIIAPDYLIKVIQQINENVVFTAPSISQRAAVCALKMRKTIQPPIIAEYKKRLYYAAQKINEINKMSVLFPPKGSFYLFVNIKKTGLTSKKCADIILEKAHVLVLPGDAFGSCGEGYLRLACTVDCEKMEEAFERMKQVDEFM